MVSTTNERKVNSFSKLNAQTIKCFQQLNPKACELPDEISQITRQEQQGELCLKNQFFHVAGKGELRSATVISKKVAIANFLFFPEPNSTAPVYASEFVSLAEKPIVAVIDAKCFVTPNKHQTLISQTLQQARKSIDNLVKETQMPEWYLKSRSGDDIFVRSPSLEQMQELMQLHLKIWEMLVETFSVANSCSKVQAELHAQALQTYKQQHCANYPGIPLLQRSFGEQWTDNYLKNYLFA